jgi:hypothetical protein
MKRIVIAAFATWWLVAAIDHEGNLLIWLPMESYEACVAPSAISQQVGYPKPLCVSLPLRGRR